MMNKEWSLEVFYRGYEDEEFTNDIEKLRSLGKEIENFCRQIDAINEEEALVKSIDYMESYELIGAKLMYYVQLRQAVDTTDSETVNILNQLDKLVSGFYKSESIMRKFIAKIKDKESYMSKYPKLKEYEYLLSNMEKEAKYILSEDVEEVIAKLNISAGSAWSSMQEYLTSILDVDYEGKEITLSEVRNMAYDNNGEIRKKAYEAELKAYEKIDDAISFSLNSIKTQVNTLCELRGYESPLMQTLESSKMKKETLDAMILAMEESMPKFNDYLKAKGELLSHENGLPWYDLFAPVGDVERRFTEEEAKDYLLKHFSEFSDDLAHMVVKSFDESWIDFNPRKGKVGGAFCLNIPFAKESRILSNFTGSLSDVVTLAHELGHAYHGMMIEEHQPLNTSYSMPVAETASTFNEALIMNAAIDEAEGDEKLFLIEGQLQDVNQIICDIYSRYLFETAVFEKSKEGFLQSSELKEMILDAQKKAYGHGLDHEYLHPYMWVNKGHYYSEDLSFYNFPYAFGGLLARGLYEKYKEEGEEFVPKYRNFLRATTVMDVEDAAKEVEIDLEDPDFWRRSLRSYEELIDEFIAMVK